MISDCLMRKSILIVANGRLIVALKIHHKLLK